MDPRTVDQVKKEGREFTVSHINSGRLVNFIDHEVSFWTKRLEQGDWSLLPRSVPVDWMRISSFKTQFQQFKPCLTLSQKGLPPSVLDFRNPWDPWVQRKEHPLGSDVTSSHLRQTGFFLCWGFLVLSEVRRRLRSEGPRVDGRDIIPMIS